MLKYSQITVDFVQQNTASSATSMRISRQWNLSKHAAVVGTSGGANMMLGLKWLRLHAISVLERSNPPSASGSYSGVCRSESGYTGAYSTYTMPGIMPCCRDCDYTLLIPLFLRESPYKKTLVLRPSTHVSSLKQAIHAQQKNMAELLGTQKKVPGTFSQGGTGISLWERIKQRLRFTVCDGSGSLRVRFFATDGESQE